MKSLVPLLAMVPRCSTASAWLMPMPLSVMVRVGVLVEGHAHLQVGRVFVQRGLVSASKRSLSQASDALETSSRRKISLLEYSEWVTRCSSWATSAWKFRVCLLMVNAVVENTECGATIASRKA
jgi:hypothetical protein